MVDKSRSVRGNHCCQSMSLVDMCGIAFAPRRCRSTGTGIRGERIRGRPGPARTTGEAGCPAPSGPPARPRWERPAQGRRTGLGDGRRPGAGHRQPRPPGLAQSAAGRSGIRRRRRDVRSDGHFGTRVSWIFVPCQKLRSGLRRHFESDDANYLEFAYDRRRPVAVYSARLAGAVAPRLACGSGSPPQGSSSSRTAWAVSWWSTTSAGRRLPRPGGRAARRRPAPGRRPVRAGARPGEPAGPHPRRVDQSDAMTGADPNPAARARVRGSGPPRGPATRREWTGIREACTG